MVRSRINGIVWIPYLITMLTTYHLGVNYTETNMMALVKTLPSQGAQNTYAYLGIYPGLVVWLHTHTHTHTLLNTRARERERISHYKTSVLSRDDYLCLKNVIRIVNF